MERAAALERVRELIETVETEPMPVPVREIWVYGDVALGLDPIERLNVYVTKDILLGGDADRAAEFEASHGIKGIGRTVRASWAEAFPSFIRANDNGHAAPEQCLAAHLLEDDEPIHLEVCNASFDDNVTQRLEGALARDAYEQILDPRGVCLWAGGRRDDDALDRLERGEFAMPTLEDALAMLGADEETAAEAAAAVTAHRRAQDGPSVRGDVV